jgi:hypothetical protein
MTVSERFPHATVYVGVASPSLDLFKGERSPERILAALGIPPEWFLNE